MIRIVKLYDKTYNIRKKETKITRIRYIYKENNTIYLDAPLKTKLINKVRNILKKYDIEYDNLIIGKPDI